MDGDDPGRSAKHAPAFSIGDMASKLEISPRAIRFYEDQGLLSPQRIGGNRVYSQRDFARLRLILRGKRLGFSLNDIREMLDLYDVDDRHIEQLNATLAKGRARIAELEQQLHEITLTLSELRDLEAMIVETIKQKEPGERSDTGSAVVRTRTQEELPTS